MATTTTPDRTTPNGRSYAGWLAVAVVALAVAARGYSLENIPGLNGDEAWYGVQAWSLAHDAGPPGWQTPTGNPINPLFLGPMAVLHVWLPPSIGLLRSLAVFSGLAALALNWLLCRWVFDRRTAAVSTVLLAILPINIAYSRFAWDASQSLAATLAVLYLALAAVRFPTRFGTWLTAAVFAQAVAIWVHPMNVFVAPVIVVAMVIHWWNTRNSTGGTCWKMLASLMRPLPLAFLGLTLFAAIAWLWIADIGGSSLAQRLQQRVASQGSGAHLPMPILLARFFSGGTIYRDLAGSRSWFEWPLPAQFDGWGLDVGLFWLALVVAILLVWQSSRNAVRCSASSDDAALHDEQDGQSPSGSFVLYGLLDRLLLAGWAATLLAFLVVAGTKALAPGQERFAVCLVAPTVLLMARAAVLAWQRAAGVWRPLFIAAGLFASVLWLADFHTHYFRFIERTGGDAHYTFRTAATEPKLAALRYIVSESHGPQWIVCSQWWNYWPLRYLAATEADIHVLTTDEAVQSRDFQAARANGSVWYVEFADTPALRGLEEQLRGNHLQRRDFSDFGGRPVLCVLHPTPPSEHLESSPPQHKPHNR